MSRKPSHIPARKAFPVAVRRTVSERSGGVCELPECEADAEHFDHIIPVAFGGTSTLKNCRHLCGPCNAEKGKLEAKMALKADKMGGRVGQHSRRMKAKQKGKHKPIQSRGFNKTHKQKLPTKAKPFGSWEKRDQ